MENKGKLIVLEGACDGVGKSTQLKLLENELSKDYECEHWHFPSYGLGIAKVTEMFLKGKLGDLNDIPDAAIESYYAIDREYVWRNYLKKYYDEGKTILLDRYTTSSFIYQCLKCNTDDERLDRIATMISYEYLNLGIQEPDLVIFLNGDFDTLTRLRLARKNNAGVAQDVFESRIETQKKIYDTAQFVSKRMKWDQVIVTEGNNMRSEEDIHKDVMSRVRKLY